MFFNKGKVTYLQMQYKAFESVKYITVYYR